MLEKNTLQSYIKMQEQFVTHEIALKLKELGFDKECLAWFAENKEIQIAPDVYKKK